MGNAKLERRTDVKIKFKQYRRAISKKINEFTGDSSVSNDASTMDTTGTKEATKESDATSSTATLQTVI